MRMKLDSLYKVNDLSVLANTAVAKIVLNKDHDIFKGHFPDNPVMPGVCMMQIIKEPIEKVLDKNLFLQTSTNIKFMAKINPETNPDLMINIAY